MQWMIQSGRLSRSWLAVWLKWCGAAAASIWSNVTSISLVVGWAASQHFDQEITATKQGLQVPKWRQLSSCQSQYHQHELNEQISQLLGGGFIFLKNLFHPDPWGRFPFWLIFFKRGWFKKPPTRFNSISPNPGDSITIQPGHAPHLTASIPPIFGGAPNPRPQQLTQLVPFWCWWLMMKFDQIWWILTQQLSTPRISTQLQTLDEGWW